MDADLTPDEIAGLKRAKALLDAVYTDPKVGLDFKRILKSKFPNLSIPEIDAAAPHVARLDEVDKKIDGLKDWITGQQRQYWDAEAWKKVKADFSLTDDGVDRVKKLMEERKISDPEAAAALLAHNNPKPISPTGFGAQRWDWMHSDDETERKYIMDLVMDPDAQFERDVHRVIAEERGLPVKIGA